MYGSKAMLDLEDEDDLPARGKVRPKVFKGEARKSPLSRAMSKVVRALVAMDDSQIAKVRPADLNRAMGEAGDHGGIFVILRTIKERGLISYSTGFSKMSIDRAKCAVALADPRDPRKR